MTARGERTFSAGSKEVTVLFTNRALATVEARLKKGIIGVAEGLVSGASGIADVAVLLQAGMEAHRIDAKLGGRSVSMDDAYKVLDKAGFAAVASPVMEAVAAVIGYKGEADEAVTESDEPDPND